MAGERWYVARVHLGPVEYPLIRLRQQSFECFAPVIKLKLFRRGRIEWVDRPIFPQYVFVQFNVDTRRWQSINGTSGIQYLLPRHLEQPLAMPAGFVEELITAQSLRQVEALTQRFARDQLVKVIAGPLRDYLGVVLSSTRRSTRVRLVMVGRELEATVPTGGLAAAS